MAAEIQQYQSMINANEEENRRMKERMDKLMRENRSLDDEVKNAQESARLSAGQMAKLNAELSDYKSKIMANETDNDTYKRHIQKLKSENSALSAEMKDAQENLRLSAGQMSKLQNELRGVCGENEELKRRLLESENQLKRFRGDGDQKINALMEECHQLNALVKRKND